MIKQQRVSVTYDLQGSRTQMWSSVSVTYGWQGPKCDQVLVWLMADKDPNVIKS